MVGASENEVSATPDSPAGLLQSLAEVAEKIASTTKKLEKTALLGTYFKQLADLDLVRAARFAAGHQFASNDSRTTNVGGSIITTALSEATGFSVTALQPIYVRLGDAGEAAYEAVKEANRHGQPAITLAETESIITRLSETRGIKNKVGVLVVALSHATPLEAKYLIKLLAGDLRIGLREGLVEDAIARAFDQPLALVAQVNMLLGDIGETAVRARAGELSGVNMRLFHPI
ncbi:MAG: DNA ligase, partial [Pyrinomonadaceae bacterium]